MAKRSTKGRRKRPGFEVEVEHREDGVTRVALIGDSERSDDARDRVAATLSELLGAGHLRLLFDVSRLEWMTVDVVGALIGDFLRLRDAGGAMIFAGLDDQVGPLLQQLGILEFMGNTEELDEAAAWLLRAAPNPRALAPKRLQLNGRREGGAKVIALRGSLGEAEARRLLRVVRTQLDKGNTKLVLDGRELLDAEGLAHLITIQSEVQRAGGALALATMWGVPGAILEVMGFGAVVPTFPDVETAATFLLAS